MRRVIWTNGIYTFWNTPSIRDPTTRRLIFFVNQFLPSRKSHLFKLILWVVSIPCLESVLALLYSRIQGRLHLEASFCTSMPCTVSYFVDLEYSSDRKRKSLVKIMCSPWTANSKNVWAITEGQVSRPQPSVVCRSSFLLRNQKIKLLPCILIIDSPNSSKTNLLPDMSQNIMYLRSLRVQDCSPWGRCWLTSLNSLVFFNWMKTSLLGQSSTYFSCFKKRFSAFLTP